MESGNFIDNPASPELEAALTALRDSEARQAYLLKLSDALRSLADPVEVQAVAMRVLGEHLKLTGARYYESDDDGEHFAAFSGYEDGSRPLFVRVRLDDMGAFTKEAYRAGRTLVVDDAQTDERISPEQAAAHKAIGMGAYVGVPLIKAGRLVVAVGAHTFGPHAWTKEEVACVEETAQRTWAAVERARAEAALRDSEERLRTLFNSIDEGFLEMEVIMSADGRALDWRYIALNPAFERLSGLTDMTGRLASEFLPNLEPEWAERFAQVVTTGEAMRFDLPATQLDRWFEVYVTRPGGAGSRRLVMVYNNVIERKRAEQALRDSEERQAFLLELSDTLRPLRDPVEVQTSTMRLLAEYLDVMRVCYFKMDPDQDGFSLTAQHEREAPPMPDHMRVSDFAPGMTAAFQKGQTFVIADTETDAPTELERASYRAIGVRAAIGVPLVKEGHFLGVFGVHSATPRRWPDAELRLIGDVADRIWTAVDRAQADAALREREERQAFLLTLSDSLRPLADPVEVQAVAMRSLGQHLRLAGAQYYESEDDGEYFVCPGGYAHGSPAIVQRVRLDDFGPFMKKAYRAGRTLVVDDVRLDTRISPAQAAAYQTLGIGAYIGVPLIKAGRLVAAAGAHMSDPHEWTTHEISLVEESVERTWAAVERARAEAALRNSEERFRQFSDASTNILWIRDAVTMRMEFASPALDKIYGFSGPERGGDDRLRSWARLIVPDDRKHVLANFKRVRAGERVEQEFRIRRGTDGDARWIKDVSFPLTDEQGRVQRVGGMGQDITAQKRAEEALREREERLGLIVENARDYAIFTIDPVGKITDWRGGAEAVFGWSRAEAIGMDARHLFTPKDRAAHELEREMGVARDDGRAPDIRWHMRKDGSRVFIDGSLTRLGDGITTGFLKIGQDMTERHRAEAALSASEGRLQTLMEGIPQLVWRSRDKGLWTWASPQWLEFTGQTQEQSQSSGWLDVIHPDDHEATKLAWSEARPHGMLDVEYRVRRATDGAWIWHHTRSVPVRNDEGRIVEWLGTSTDVQVLKEFQQRQSVLVAELQHRTRNLIAIVRSTSDKTARGSADLTDFRGRFRERLDALARVQGLLSRLNDLERVTFDDLIEAEMTAMNSDPDKVTLEGPAGIRLRSSTVQTLAMGLHELATNAVKYGALRQPNGRLAVTWRWESSGEGGKPWLHIDWRETGVTMAPIGDAPRGSGQGRELIERALPYQLGAKTSYELGSDGVHCTISFAVSATAGSEEDHDRPHAPRLPHPGR